MAIYRCEFKIISRSAGHRACAAAAYRAAEKIADQRYGVTHDYSRKSNVAASFILAPENAPAWMLDRTELWNAVEAVERRKDAQLCREVLLSLPHELTDVQREELVRQFVSEQFVAQGMIADVNIHHHSPSGDERNDHAHVLLTTRTLTADAFGPKERSWNSKEFVHETREAWALAQNRLFEGLGLEIRVDHRSLADQGIDREPEPKLGPHATEALRNGEPEKADRAVEAFEAVAERNAERVRLEEQREVIDLALARLDRARDRDQGEYAGLAFLHARQMSELQQEQANALRALKGRDLATLRAAVRKARADHAAFREELKPGFLRRLGEIVLLQGKAKRQERDRQLRSFNSMQDAKLNALRATLRHNLADLKTEHAKARDDLRAAQRLDRDALDRRLEAQAVAEREALLRQREDVRAGIQGLGDAKARAQAPSPALPSSSASSPATTPEAVRKAPDEAETATERPQEPRKGLSGVWDRHAPESAPEAAAERDEGRTGEGSSGGSDERGLKPVGSVDPEELASPRKKPDDEREADVDREDTSRGAAPEPQGASEGQEPPAPDQVSPETGVEAVLKFLRERQARVRPLKEEAQPEERKPEPETPDKAARAEQAGIEEALRFLRERKRKKEEAEREEAKKQSQGNPPAPPPDANVPTREQIEEAKRNRDGQEDSREYGEEWDWDWDDWDWDRDDPERGGPSR